MTKKEVSIKLNVTSETVRNWIRDGVLVPDEKGEFKAEDVMALDTSKYEDSFRWCTIQQAAHLLGLTRATIFTYCSSGTLIKESMRVRSFISLASIRDHLMMESRQITGKLNNVVALMEQ